MRQDIVRSRRIRDADFYFSERRVGRAGHRFAPRKCGTGLRLGAVALADRGARPLELRSGEPVLGNPKRKRARFERRRAVGALRHASEARRQRDGEYRQRDQNLDQREAPAAT